MDVTVAICTWNRAPVLAETLQVLSQLHIPVGLEWECIVVNNNCTDATDDVIAANAQRIPIRRAFEPVAGLARARNCAGREARGDLVLFLDDDIRVDADWMAAYLDAAARWPAASYFGGVIEPLYPGPPPLFVSANLEALAGLLALHDFGPHEHQFGEDEAPYGGNMAFRRAALAQHSFDERLGHHHADRVMGEEYAFFDLLRANGHRGVWVPAARVKHLIAPQTLTAAGIRRHFFAYGRTLVRLNDTRRTWVLKFPRVICRAYCTFARHRIAFKRRIGATTWAPLLARCATLEGILEEAGASAPGSTKTSAEALDE
jgi:glycosyltransferase involved in cell wall biosynthesis